MKFNNRGCNHLVIWLFILIFALGSCSSSYKSLTNDKKQLHPALKSAIEDGISVKNLPQTRHSGKIMGITFSPDGKYIASSAIDNSVRIWHAGSGRLLNIFPGNAQTNASLMFDPSMHYLLGAPINSNIKKWNLNTEETEFSVESGSWAGNSTVISEDGKYAVTALNSTEVVIFDMETGKVLDYTGDKLISNNSKVNTLTFNRHSDWLAFSSNDNDIICVDIKTGEEVLTIKGHNNYITAIAFSPAGNYIASGDNKGMIIIWDIEMGVKVANWRGYRYDRITTLLFSKEGDYLYSGQYGKIGKWDVAGRSHVSYFPDFEDAFDAIDISPDGKIIASGSNEGNIYLWRTDTGERIGNDFGKEVAQIFLTGVDNKCKYINATSVEQKIFIWDNKTSSFVNSIPDLPPYIPMFTIDPDGDYWLFTGSKDLLFVSTDRADKKRFKGHQEIVYYVTISPDRRWILTIGADKTLRFWNPDSEKPVATHEINNKYVSDFKFTKDGQSIAFINKNRQIEMWDVPDAHNKKTYDAGNRNLSQFCFCPDKNTVACSDMNYPGVSIFNLEPAKYLKKIQHAGGPARLMCFDSKRNLLFIASDFDGKIICIDVESGKTKNILEGQRRGITGLKLIQERDELFSSSRDGTVKLWDYMKGELERTYVAYTDGTGEVF